MSPWRRSRRRFHSLRPSDSFPYTLTCLPMAAGRSPDPARAAERHSHLPARQPSRCHPGSRAGAGRQHPGRGPAAVLFPPPTPLQSGPPGIPLRRVVTEAETGLWVQLGETPAESQPLKGMAGRGGRPGGPEMEAIPPLPRADTINRLSTGRGLEATARVCRLAERPRGLAPGRRGAPWRCAPRLDRCSIGLAPNPPGPEERGTQSSRGESATRAVGRPLARTRQLTS